MDQRSLSSQGRTPTAVNSSDGGLTYISIGVVLFENGIGAVCVCNETQRVQCRHEFVGVDGLCKRKITDDLRDTSGSAAGPFDEEGRPLTWLRSRSYM